MIIGDIDTFDPDKIANRFYILFSRNWSKTEIFNSNTSKDLAVSTLKEFLNILQNQKLA